MTGNIVPRALEDLAQPHVESFDYFIGDGLGYLMENMRPVEVCYLLALLLRFVSNCLLLDRQIADHRPCES